jgi:hypothetical protein
LYDVSDLQNRKQTGALIKQQMEHLRRLIGSLLDTPGRDDCQPPIRRIQSAKKKGGTSQFRPSLSAFDEP